MPRGLLTKYLIPSTIKGYMSVKGQLEMFQIENLACDFTNMEMENAYQDNTYFYTDSDCSM